jgi:2-oxoglutarate ferredoxin oxidoreductase subunit gamma
VKKAILSAGFGGQGIMLLGQLLGYAGCIDGKEATFYPFYGPEQRGGTASCTTIISDTPIGTPVVASCDIFIALNKPSLLRFQDKVKPDGTIVTTPEVAANREIRQETKVLLVPADSMAKEIGSVKIANLVLLAVIAHQFNMLSYESLEKAILQKLGKKKELLDMNISALKAGWNFIADYTP